MIAFWCVCVCVENFLLIKWTNNCIEAILALNSVKLFFKLWFWRRGKNLNKKINLLVVDIRFAKWLPNFTDSRFLHSQGALCISFGTSIKNSESSPFISLLLLSDLIWFSQEKNNNTNAMHRKIFIDKNSNTERMDRIQNWWNSRLGPNGKKRFLRLQNQWPMKRMSPMVSVHVRTRSLGAPDFSSSQFHFLVLIIDFLIWDI